MFGRTSIRLYFSKGFEKYYYEIEEFYYSNCFGFGELFY